MTKLFSTLVMLTLSLATLAQQTDENTTIAPTQDATNSYKPEARETSLEVQFEPFGDNPVSINGIRARFFKSPNKAVRLNVFLGYDVDSDITQQAVSNTNLRELKDRTAIFSLNIRPGYEWHLKGTKKLSPYFGMEMDLGYQISRFKSEVQNGDDVNYTLRKNDNGFFRIGANAIAGLDFYVAKKLYLGTEMGFGASVTRLLDVEVESDVTGFQEPDPLKRGSAFDIGPNVNVDIRLGYVF
ncbi:hypothetical protein FNH22_14215 [Fulvivirga sp. M361]|uniref:hypothetical protein n=1 Tax=Fulvivirga sp. M361 TaxID=2594266 RepID=UPI00117A2F27|nr:hypothetical protein [Fulvivirga sp. M361]TRX58214.1 hypothetical protein FNH22_14215 [Fulvivirga sp. M361]